MAAVFPSYAPTWAEIALGIALGAVVSVLVIFQAAAEDPPTLAVSVLVFHFVTIFFVGIELLKGKGVNAPIAMGTIGSGISATLFQTAIVGAAEDPTMPAVLLAFQAYANALQLGFIFGDLRLAVGRGTGVREGLIL